MSIARQFGLANWKDIYQSPANAAFRARRPDPNHINAGEQILIPPTPQQVQQVLQGRIDNLMRLRFDTDAMYQRIKADLDNNLQHYENVSRGADAAATVANVLVGLGNLVVKGVAAMKLTGSALSAANKQLSKAALTFAADPLQDPILKYGASRINANDGIVWAVGKTAIEAWLSINSPSWWAALWVNRRDGMTWSQAVTTDPMDVIRAVRDGVERQRANTLRLIDRKIRDSRSLLYGVAANGLLSLYDRGMPTYA
jgi:hypothetical protein